MSVVNRGTGWTHILLRSLGLLLGTGELSTEWKAIGRERVDTCQTLSNELDSYIGSPEVHCSNESTLLIGRVEC
jgi:hypothetical protein